MDAREMSYDNESFDIVIDKGTTDAVLCGEDSYLNMALIVSECQRVLKTGGKYIVISHGIPEIRKFHFERKNLAFDI